MKINFRKIVSLLLVCVLLVGSMASINVSAEESGAKLEFVSNNLFYGETLNLMYAVKATNLPENAEIKVTLYNADETVFCGTTADGTVEIDGAECYAFIANLGVAAQNISHSYLAKAEATVDGAVVASTDYYEYSVLEYLYERLIVNANEKDDDGNSTVSDEQKAMYKDLLQYAKSAEIVLTETAAEDRIDQYVYVAVLNDGTVDGVNASGMYKIEDVVTPVSTLTPNSGYVVSWKVIPYDASCNEGNATLVLDSVMSTGLTLNSSITLSPSVVKDTSNVEPESLAVFEFGANGSATHKDGSTNKASYSETQGKYTLSLTGGTNMYPSSYDAKGNSCIKLGASSKTGGFTFTVADNIKSVVIKVSGYKDKTVTVDINGTKYAITEKSNDGEYKEITIDTTTTKTVKLVTSTGYRAMVNSIEFIGIPEN